MTCTCALQAAAGTVGAHFDQCGCVGEKGPTGMEEGLADKYLIGRGGAMQSGLPVCRLLYR